jgi:uncharacterized membrane protein
MASDGAQIAALAFAIIGTIISCLATVNERWAKSDVSGQVMESIKYTMGLWSTCQEATTGHNTCDTFDSLLLGAEPHLIASRFFCVLSIVLGTVAIFLFLNGMSCSTISKNPTSKKKMRLTSGIMIVIGGALLAISGIFMGVYIVRHYQDTYAIGINYNNYNGQNNNGGYSSASFFGRRRRDADDLDGDAPVAAGLHETKLDAFLEACEMSAKPCNASMCDGNVECEAAVTKNVKAFQRGQAMVFGMGTFLAIIGGCLMLLSGGLMISQGCGGDEDIYEDSEYPNSGYNQGAPIVQGQKSNYL